MRLEKKIKTKNKSLQTIWCRKKLLSEYYNIISPRIWHIDVPLTFTDTKQANQDLFFLFHRTIESHLFQPLAIDRNHKKKCWLRPVYFQRSFCRTSKQVRYLRRPITFYSSYYRRFLFLLTFTHAFDQRTLLYKLNLVKKLLDVHKGLRTVLY